MGKKNKKKASKNKEKPSEDKDKPSEDKDKPSEDKEKPSEDKDKPSEDKEKPSEDKDKPSEDKDKPSEDKDKPGKDRPSVPNKSDGVSQDSAESTENIITHDEMENKQKIKGRHDSPRAPNKTYADSMPDDDIPCCSKTIRNPARIDPNEKPDKVSGPAKSTAMEQAPRPTSKTASSHAIYPLTHAWTFWYLEYDRHIPWEEMQNAVGTFSTANEFYDLYFHLVQPSELKPGSDYSLFKENIRPMWEDEANKNGGRWVVTLPATALKEFDRIWCDVQLCLIGGEIKWKDQICGAVANVRAQYKRISIWTSRGDDREAILAIGRQFREKLKLNNNSLHYELHKDVQAKTNKPLYKL